MNRLETLKGHIQPSGWIAPPYEHIIMNSENPKYTIIWMCGTREKEHMYKKYFEADSEEAWIKDARVVIMVGPLRDCKYLMPGVKMRQWFLEKLPGISNQEELYSIADMDTFNEMEPYIYSVLTRELEIVGDDPQRLILGGFSQGGIILNHFLVKFKLSVRGLFAVSSVFSNLFEMAQIDSTLKENVNFLFLNGEDDPLIAPALATEIYE